jgi:tetratricopeptide (TPR) repeat protein
MGCVRSLSGEQTSSRTRSQKKVHMLKAISLFALSLMMLTAALGVYPSASTSTISDLGRQQEESGSAKRVGNQRAQSISCSSAEECLKLGQKYLSNLPFDRRTASEVLERAVALDPSNGEAYKALATAYMRRDGAVLGRSYSDEELRKAEATCRSATSLLPNDPEPFLLLGEILNLELSYRLRTDFSNVEALKKAIELKPAWPEAYCKLAHGYNLLSRYEEAIAAYETEAALRREDEDLHRNETRSPIILEAERSHQAADAYMVAQMCAKLGADDKALAALQRAKDLQPQDDLIRFWLVKTLLNLGDIESARREQKALVELCRSKNEYLVKQCEGMAKELLEAIEQKSK